MKRLLLLLPLAFTGCHLFAAYAPAPKGATFDYTIEPAATTPATVNVEVSAPASQPAHVDCGCEDKWISQVALNKEFLAHMARAKSEPKLTKPADNDGPPRPVQVPAKAPVQAAYEGDCPGGVCPPARRGLPVVRRFGRR